MQASSYFGDDAIISYDDVGNVKKLRETIFGYLVVNSTVHRDDIYDKSTLDRQFYTVPSTTIPNNREKLGDWLYNRGPSCKEGNISKCYNNLYNDIKNSVQI